MKRMLLALVVLSVAGAVCAQTVKVEPRGFTITTPRLSATVRDGVIIGLKNLKSGEVHADPLLEDVRMPRGLGHMAGQVKAMEALHCPWGNQQMNQDVPPGTQFPTMHFPGPDSKFSSNAIKGGVRGVWRGLTNGTQRFPDETLQVECWADAATGQLLFKAIASSGEPGVYGVQVPLANLHAQHRAYVPSFGGVMYDNTNKPGLITLGSTPFWEAPVIALEGQKSSVGLWVEDAKFRPNFCFLNFSGKSFSAAIEQLNYMPYEQQVGCESVTWHLDVFPGGWVDAMTPYKQWYSKTFAPEMKVRAEQKWADKIQVVVDHIAPTDEVCRQLATTFDPETVLVHDWNARAPDFDTLLPDWTPRAGYADKVKLLQSYGFHTMAYVNTYCANYNSPVWQRDKLSDFALLRSRGSISNYREKPLTFADLKDNQLLYLDPLSPRWRKYHTDMMLTWRKETGTDANYEDVGGTGGDFGNGTVEGLAGAQGATAQFRELLRRNPGVPMASEYAPDHMAFAVRWPLRYQQVWGNAATRVWWMEHQRPISAYIHGPGARAWIPVINAEGDFQRNVVVACSDALGGMAQLSATPGELSASAGMGYHMKYRAQLFAGRQLKPVFSPARQDKSLACVYEDRDGRRYEYSTTPTVQQMMGPEGKPLYQRITGLNSFATPLAIPGWPAAADGKVIGLNPEIRYALSPGQADRAKVQVTALPADVKIARYVSTPHATVVALAPTDKEGPSEGMVTVQPNAKFATATVNDQPVELAAAEKPEPLTLKVTLPTSLVFAEKAPPTPKVGEWLGTGQEKGRFISMSTGLERGGEYVIPFRAAWAVPGEQPSPEFMFLNGGSESEIALDYLVTVPNAQSSLLVYVRNNQVKYGNGGIARLYVNGREAHALDLGPTPNPDWKEGMDRYARNRWDTDVHGWRVPLGHLAGKPVLVTIASDAKGENNSDQLWWTRPKFVNDPEQKAKFVRFGEKGEAAE
ncbi:MAG: DUF6259 domain-containing protein [Armatimonadota bacterium]